MKTSIHARSASTGRQLGRELSLRLSQLLDFADVDRGQQVISRRKVTVERPGSDLRALSDLVHAGLRASACEDLLCDFENPLTIALRVSAGLRAVFFAADVFIELF